MMERAVKNWSVKRSGGETPTGLQAHIAFHLGGIRRGGLESIEGHDLRPALYARYKTLTDLRYDFPLVLLRNGADENSVQSLSAFIDGACDRVATGADGDRLRRTALKLERQVREVAAERGAAAWRELRDGAIASLGGDANLRADLVRLAPALDVDADVVDCGAETAQRLCVHLWQATYRQRHARFHERVDALIAGLQDILRADFMRSTAGLSAPNLKASIGGGLQNAFDFDALSNVLSRRAPQTSLSASRRARIDRLLATLQSQRFYPAGDSAVEPYAFEFQSCADAIAAYRARLPDVTELAKAFAVAELELDGAYHEARHDAFFETFSEAALDPATFDLFPDYLVCVRSEDMQAADNEAILEASAGGLRAKVLIQTDDILEPSPVAGGNIAFGMRSKRLTNAALALSEVFVVQSAASNLLRYRGPIYRAFAYAGPALISVYSGAAANGVPAYLNAAAAMESRTFPAFAYDPSAGADWASRFDLSDNPQADSDWPVHPFDYEDATHQRRHEEVAFTLVDFVASDPRYATHFAIAPRSAAGDSLVSVREFLSSGRGETADTAPCILMVDSHNDLQKAIVDDALIREARRCAEMWRNLQELGGIHNSHAARLVAQERKAWETKQGAAPDVVAAEAPAAAAPAEAPTVAPAEMQVSSDDPYIETPRCTTCNECTQISDRIFAYDANKQAFIANPDGGTYAQLVEAAESCQVSIIHPGKPRNPDEPGLEDLIARAEAFM
jgi:hypothetical protein